MTERGNVFLRWVRLKHEAKTTAQQAEAVSTDVEAATEQPGINAAMQEPFDLASLPSIESIAADTDIVAFLRIWRSDRVDACCTAPGLDKRSGHLRLHRHRGQPVGF